ncbi:helix-turn-helix domain-containing protein [Herbiconiux liukaitaii]|uniref:helix-turn-helix domain-containing protein n=1 Tax=Herbiconiux liukaitaii TaxID=3342799 RepID=UPI0035B7A3BC
MTDERAAAAAVLLEATQGDADRSAAEVYDALAALGVAGDDGRRLAEAVNRSHREHVRLRRREQELTALFSSARELAEVRETAALLDRLVERAHDMMGSDLTYLSEFDPLSRELNVRTTTGSVSPAFRTLRVPPGRGLASVVVETRAPLTVLRYDEYREERHDPSIDAAVNAEGIVSMLGVPMLSGDDVLGVLFVATRTEYSFAPEQIALLSALADHASIVLQTARTLRSLQRSEDEARRALDRLTGHLAERDRSNTVHQELVHAVLAGGGFAPLAGTLSSALRRAVTVIDEHGVVMAASGGSAESGSGGGGSLRLDAPTLAAIEQSRLSGHCVLVDEDDDENRDGMALGSPREAVRAVSALVAGSQRFGAVLLGGGEFELGPVDRRTIERAAQVGALLALQQQAVAEAEHRVQSELVAELLAADPQHRGDVERRVRRLGVDARELDGLTAYSVPGEHRAAASRTLAALVGPRSLVGEHNGLVVVLSPSGPSGSPQGEVAAETASPLDPADLRRRTAAALAAPVLAVSAPPSRDLAAAFDSARRTARLLGALGVDDITASTDDYLPYSAVLDADERALRSFIDRSIGAVRRYDADRGTELLRTLRAFVRCNASPTRTARHLNFHTNTILQRLDRLDRVLGDDWRGDERFFRLSIAVRLDELRDELSGTRETHSLNG